VTNICEPDKFWQWLRGHIIFATVWLARPSFIVDQNWKIFLLYSQLKLLSDAEVIQVEEEIEFLLCLRLNII